MPMSNAPDPKWPRIQESLVNTIEEMKETLEAFKEVSLVKEKTYSDLIIEVRSNLKNHHDALYGYMNMEGVWIKGIIQTSQEETKIREASKIKVDKAIGWLLIGIFTALGVSIIDIFFKFWKFITGQSH